ncbi:hypothetical protein [Halomonas sp.]|uniref:hypothetical protein n=1 Tax=Halomonas sp. TaxID=1486246 RepID=UPI003D13480D
MTRLAQTATAQRPATPRSRLAAIDLSHEDIVRPELRDDAILADRTRRAERRNPRRQDDTHRPAPRSASIEG